MLRPVFHQQNFCLPLQFGVIFHLYVIVTASSTVAGLCCLTAKAILGSLMLLKYLSRVQVPLRFEPWKQLVREAAQLVGKVTPLLATTSPSSMEFCFIQLPLVIGLERLRRASFCSIIVLIYICYSMSPTWFPSLT